MAFPSELPYSTDAQFYIDELRRLYNGRTLITPDGYEIEFFLDGDAACMHALCGKRGEALQYSRARKITYIEPILMDESLRVVRFNKQSRNICFVSNAHSYVIICSVQSGKKLKFITQFYDQNKKKTYIRGFENPAKYRPI